MVPQSLHTVGMQRSQNKRAVVLCIGRAAASCLTQQRYLLVQQLPQISFRVGKNILTWWRVTGELKETSPLQLAAIATFIEAEIAIQMVV